VDEATYRTFTKEQMCREVLGGDFSPVPVGFKWTSIRTVPKAGHALG